MKMKAKLKIGVISCMLALGCSLQASNDVGVDDLNWYWNFAQKKCTAASFKNKGDVIKDIRNGYLIVNKDFTNSAGRILELVGEDDRDKTEFNMIFTSTYGECRFYEDLVVKDMKNAEAKQYVNVKTASDKPATK